MTFPSKETLTALHAYRREFMRVNCLAPRFITFGMLERLGIDIKEDLTANGNTLRVLGMDIVDSIPSFTFAGNPYSLVEKIFEDSQSR